MTRLVLRYGFERMLGGFFTNMRLMWIEGELFLGTILFCTGLLGFESDKYCDGNSADYLSCTRPATYYYFDAIDIALITIGIIFVILWLLKRGGAKE